MARQHSKTGACAFCKKRGLEILSDSSFATGSYFRIEDESDGGRPKPFRGFVCDFHRDEIRWKTFKWQP